MKSTTNKKFKWKYVLSWLIMGAIPALTIVVSSEISKEFSLVDKFGMFLGVSLVPAGYGLLGMFLEAGVRYKWRFNEIEHSVLVWHIYPIVALFQIVFAVVIGTAIAAWPFK